MFKNKLSILIEKDNTIIKCKKLAKIFFRSYKAQNIKKTLMQCQSLAAIELGYQDWFDLQNTIKKKQEFLLAMGYEENIDLLQKILIESIEKKVDYVSIEVKRNIGYIIFAINGQKIVYNQGNAYTEKYLRDFCQSVIYHLSELSNIKPQIFTKKEVICINSLFNIYVNNINTEISLEIKSLPSYPEGYDFYIKYNVLNQITASLKELGFEKNQIEQFYSATGEKYGLIMMGGGNNSGRTSTLKSLTEYLSQINNKNIYNLAQPLEYKIKNVNNINVQEKTYHYFPYVEPVKTALSNKADIIFIDKIMDQSTTALVYEAAQQALVISTVNANSIFQVLDRFKDGGLNKEQIGKVGFLKLVGHQKLIPVVCDKCYHKVEDTTNLTDLRLKQEYTRFLKSFKDKYPKVHLNKIKLRNHNGCKSCHNTGVMGKTVCASMMEIDTTVLNYIKEDNLEACKNYYISLSDKKIDSSNMKGKSTMEHAIYKMLQGYLDPLDVERYFLSIEDFIIRTY